MNTRKAVRRLIVLLVVVVAWGGAYPALAGLLFSGGGSGSPPGPAASNPDSAIDGGFAPRPVEPLSTAIFPHLPLTLMPPILTPTNTPKFKIPIGTLIVGPILTLILVPTDTPGGPTSTPTPTATSTPTPTDTSTPTPTHTPKPTKTPKPTWTPVPCFFDAAFVADITIPDGTQIRPGAAFQKIWRVQNIGNCPWGPGVELVFVAGNPFGAPPVQFVPPAVPGAPADIVVNMFAPASPGLAESHWQLRAPNGNPFGPDIFARINVVPAAPPPPPPLPTPTPAPVEVPTLIISTPATVPTPIILTPPPVSTAPQPVGTPDTSTFVSARQAYDLASPQAVAWKSTAVLSSVTCLSVPPQPGFQAGIQFFTPTLGPAMGKCGVWRLVFLDSPTPQPGGEQYVAVVMGGQLDEALSKAVPLSGQPGVVNVQQPLDSPAALQAYMRAGGADFFLRYPLGRITGMTLHASANPVWTISATSRPDYGPGSTWLVNLDAATGTVDNTPPTTAQPGRVYLSAREALAVALPAAAAWQSDAQLVDLQGQVNPDEDGHDVGKASNWSFEFASPSARLGYTLNVVDGVVRNAAPAPTIYGDPVAGDWPDSPTALQTFSGTPDYNAFKALHPQAGFSFELLGDAQQGYIWIVGAYDNGAAVTVNINGLK